MEIIGSLVTLKLCVIREFSPSISNGHMSALVKMTFSDDIAFW